jgi:hypothetical protein
MHACIDGSLWTGVHRLTYICVYVCLYNDIHIYNDIHVYLYLNTCTSERRRDARVGVRLWRMRARARPRGLHLP